MRRMLLVAAMLALGVVPLWSQQSDSVRPRREELRKRLDERFTSRVREELGLTDQQSARLRETATTFGGRRRELGSASAPYAPRWRISFARASRPTATAWRG